MKFRDFLKYIFAVYFVTDILLGRKYSISPTSKDKQIYAVKTDFVSQVYIIRTKIHYQIKIPSARKPGACVNEHLAFF